MLRRQGIVKHDPVTHDRVNTCPIFSLIFTHDSIYAIVCNNNNNNNHDNVYGAVIVLRALREACTGLCTRYMPCQFCLSVDSALSLGVYYFLSLTLSVCMSVMLLLQIASSFLFLDGIQPFFASQFSMWHSTKLFSLIFDLGPVTPNIYSPKFALAQITYNSACMTDRPEMFAPSRGFSGMADSMEPCTMLWGRPLLPWQRNFGKFGLFFVKITYKLACMPDRPDMFGPTGETTRGRSLLSWQ